MPFLLLFIDYTCMCKASKIFFTITERERERIVRILHKGFHKTTPGVFMFALIGELDF